MGQAKPGPPTPGGGRGLPRRTLLTLLGGLVVVGAAGAEAMAGQVVDPVADDAALPGPRQPLIRDCRSWHARDPSGDLVVVGHRPTNILVHHTATENQDSVGVADLDELARAIQNYHMDDNGWIDSGHQFLVNRGGLIAEGRHRSLEMLRGGRSFIEGSHCTDHNDDSIGIENQGTYTEVDPPPAQLASLRALLAFACVQYKVSPGHLYGHRDFGDTSCPGDRLYAMLPALRTQVARLIGRGGAQRASAPGYPGMTGLPDLSGSPEPSGTLAPPDSSGTLQPLTWPLLRVADRGPRVLAAQHLLRAAGIPKVAPDGQYGRATADGVFEFQRRNGTEQTGMIGGASWPRLAVSGRSGSGGEADAAVRALVSASSARRFDLPATLDARTWQRLLAAAPAH
jgi:hypothetical protein